VRKRGSSDRGFTFFAHLIDSHFTHLETLHCPPSLHSLHPQQLHIEQESGVGWNEAITYLACSICVVG